MKLNDPNEPLRVSMIVSGFPALSQTFVSLQLAELVRRGHRVNVYSLGRRGQWEWLPAGTGEVIGDIRVRHLGTYARKRKKNRLLLLQAAYLLAVRPRAVWSAFKENLREGGYKEVSRLITDAYLMRDLCDSDVVHCQFVTLVPRVLRLRELGFLGEHGDAAGDEPKVVCSVRGYDITKGKYRDRSFWTSMIRGVDHFLPVCASLQSELIGKGCDKPISIVRSPVNIDHIQSAHIQESKGALLRLVSIGRLVEKKGFIDALYAMRILKAKGLAFQYFIIGDGELMESLTEYVVSHEMSECVQLLGALPSAEALKVLESSHILLAPSKAASDGDSEGIPNVLKEAMFMGIQVVSTTHSGIPELIEHERNGYLAAEDDPEGLARLIESVANNADRWEVVAKRAAATVASEYAPQKTTDDLIEAYRSALA